MSLIFGKFLHVLGRFRVFWDDLGIFASLPSRIVADPLNQCAASKNGMLVDLKKRMIFHLQKVWMDQGWQGCLPHASLGANAP